ncbi:hypothetical protein [Variovorax arabinosiphilus]|uniref:hypothetical protein n=1 Tax=Variovorax arabinosiphilus TaxID=3053498 RepID=UPI0025774CBE|nr:MULTISPECIES: hypothetical protein [unclassified Variovorax]MDM0118857.1 hypothetical protein [Variovorax sp. J2L1-78]MDM0129282.1 hypothetical protein [Variovorax sp. J2L1-63]MDM0232931.1 hypothetical protein [Variovorax sp. J2R1-6]
MSNPRTVAAHVYGADHVHPPVVSMRVTLDRITGRVRAIGHNSEVLDQTLGQIHDVPEGVTPVIGEPCPTLELRRNLITGQPD